MHAVRAGSITAVAVKLARPLAAGAIRLVVYLNGSPTAAAVEVGPGQEFATATFDKYAVPVAPGAAVELYASSGAAQDPSPLGMDAIVELES